MNDDLLDRATRALRSATAPRNDGADELLARIERARVRRLSNRKHRMAALAAAAVSMGTFAWAATSEKLSTWFEQGSPRPVSSPSSAPRAVMTKPHRAEPLKNSPPAAPALSGDPVQPLGAAAPEPQRTERAAERSTRATPAAPTGAPSASVDVEELYREAHRTHFTRRDWASATAAWKRYLDAAGPNGRFWLEARYNHAIALYRAGDRQNAIRALEPFAAGEYGGYRRDEARALLDELTSASHPPP